MKNKMIELYLSRCENEKYEPPTPGSMESNEMLEQIKELVNESTRAEIQEFLYWSEKQGDKYVGK